MLSETLPVGENACNFQERSSTMDPDCAVEELSVSMQSYEPFSVNANYPFESSIAADKSGSELLIGAFNSINIVEPYGLGDDKGENNAKSADACQMESPNTLCFSPPRRNARTTKLNQKTQSRRAGRHCGKRVIKKPLLDSVLLRVARKRRSTFCKPAQSSVWGSLDITKLFEQNIGGSIDQNEHTKSRRAQVLQGKQKRNKNQVSASLEKPKAKTHSSTGHIRLKIKLGKETSQNCQADNVSLTDNGRENYGTNVEVAKLTNDNEKKLSDEVHGINGFCCFNGAPEKAVMLLDSSHLDACLKNKDLENTVIAQKPARGYANNHQKVPSQRETEKLGISVDDKYLDSGTSPDSEVINLTPEAQVHEKVQDDLLDILISPRGHVGRGEVGSLNLPQKNGKKVKKKDKASHGGVVTVENSFPSPEIINKASPLEKQGQKEKTGDVFYSSDASILTTTANLSSNTSGSEGFSRESLHFSRVTGDGISCEALKVESGTEENLRFRLGVGLQSTESYVSEKKLPFAKTKGRKHVRSSKSIEVSKSGSEASDSYRSCGGNACRRKGKSIKGKKVKDKVVGDQVVCKVENHPEAECHLSDDPGETRAGVESTTKDILNLNMVPRVVGEQYLPPKNAWVCCDDCFKWRRIPATLADSIEETNCIWTCKDNMDKGFADCSIPQEKSNAEINAELEISDASCEEDARDARLNSQRVEEQRSAVHRRPLWRLIKSNLFLHRNRKTQTIDEIMVCQCKPPPNGRMGCGDKCLNRMLNIECVKGTCPCGDLCSNQQFQKRKYAKLKWFHCGKKGFGLQLLEDISEGQFLIEYVGEVLDMLAYERRQREYASKGHKHFYFMTLNGNEVIDACAKGNLGRFINHSCDPNCRTEKWMVNGEVCIGLFALRNIKKGEEVTFDYNYVRVFGAAVKKCVCGSSQCRGYIGGDRLNTEIVVQGDSDDEYPEPALFCEDGEIDNWENLISATSSFDDTEMQIADSMLASKDKMEKHATTSEHLESTTELQTAAVLLKEEDGTDKSTNAVQHMDISSEEVSLNKSSSCEGLQNPLEMDDSIGKLPSPVRHGETTISSKKISYAQQDLLQRLDNPAPTVISCKTLSDTIVANNCKFDTIEDRHPSKPHPLLKASRSSSSVKKGKLGGISVDLEKHETLINKSHLLPFKSRKLLEGSLNGRFEAVEEKLNELLDAYGGISKRKDAPKGYLKLLLLTANSGENGNGEAIQSNRDLSMILDALLKTKSRVVLADIINKNGLQLLHNIMKRYRRDFNKIPILRKLLKVLEFLAMREILTLEQINEGPSRAGVESFRESMLTLTEHDDKQVHQIARNFRDRWIPRSSRKNSMDRRDGWVDHRGSNYNRYSVSHNHWRDQGEKTTEAMHCDNQSIVATNSVDVGILEGNSASCGNGCPTSSTKTRKRKSRWDQPAEANTDVRSPQQKLQKSDTYPQPAIGEVLLYHKNGLNGADKQCFDNMHGVSQKMNANGADVGEQSHDEDAPPGFLLPLDGPTDGEQSVDEDAPPGFSLPLNGPSSVIDTHGVNSTPTRCPDEVVMGHPRERFINRSAVSYGIPLPVVQQFGIPQGETLESWIVGPGVPFCPFPPLPSYPRNRREPPASAGNSVMMNRHPAICHSDQNTPSTSGARPPEAVTHSANNQHIFQQVQGSCNLGRRYFRQQKWNNSTLRPPWIRNRNAWGFMGNNSRNGICGTGAAPVSNEIRGPTSSDVSAGMVSSCNTFYQYPQQQNLH